MSGVGARGQRLTVPQRDFLLVLVLLPLIAIAGLAVSYATNRWGMLAILPLLGVGIALGVLGMLGMRAALFLLAFSLAFPFRNEALIQGVDLHTTHLLLPLIGVLVAVQLAYGKLKMPRGMLFPMMLMLIGGVIAAVAGPEPEGSLTRLIFGLALPMLAGIVAAAVIEPERDIGPLSVVLGISLVGVGLLAIAQVVGAAPSVFAPIFGERVNGLFYHPNILGAYLAANIVLFAAIAAFRGQGGVPFLIPIGLGIAALVATLSRGPFLGLLAGMLLVAFLLGKRRPKSLLAIVIILPVAAAVALPEAPTSETTALSARFNEAFEPDAESGRKAIWDDAERTIAAHPLTGIGALTFADTFTQPATTPGIDPDITHAHNMFLEGYMSIGPLGMFGLAWLLIGAVRRLWAASGRFDKQGRIVGGWSIGVIGALFSFIVSAMVDFPFWQVEVMAFVFLLIGSAYAIGERPLPEPAPNASAVRARNRSVPST